MATKEITIKDVEKTAELSALKLSEDEKKDFAKIFSDTLSYINILEELDTSNVKETYQVNDLRNVFQSPDFHETLSVDDALSNASAKERNLFGTSAVFDR